MKTSTLPSNIHFIKKITYILIKILIFSVAYGNLVEKKDLVCERFYQFDALFINIIPPQF